MLWAGALAWPDEPLLAAVDLIGGIDGEEWAEARAVVETADMAREDTRVVQWVNREGMWAEDSRVRTRFVWRDHDRCCRNAPTRTFRRERPSLLSFLLRMEAYTDLRPRRPCVCAWYAAMPTR